MKQALIGAGGHAQEIRAHMGDFKIPCFVDNEYWKPNANYIFPLSEFDPNEYKVIIAIGNSKDRYDISQKLPKETQYFTYIHPSAQFLHHDIHIEEGSFIGANCILTFDIKIGKHSLLNRSVNIGHNSRIGDYFSAMPGAVVSGNVQIYDLVYMGTNSSIKEKLSIHSLATIGSNAAVVKHIEEPGTYVGVPAKKIK
jgi:sugar O-acyltransferase (sialic acid O-acetyltransferase NeuD family)